MTSKCSSLPILLLFLCTCFAACTSVNVYERNTDIPGHRWHYEFQPDFSFEINDTAALYNLYLVLRHTDAYQYNNIWINVGTQSPGDSMRYQKFDLQLGNDASGWEGSGMDNIWELRKSITRGPFKFNKPGLYQFKLAQVMRENPLPAIVTVGVRVEKAK